MRPLENIRRARKALRLTQEALGALVGVSGVAVGYWESGASYPEGGRLPAVAAALGMTVGQVLDVEPLPDDVAPLCPTCADGTER